MNDRRISDCYCSVLACEASIGANIAQDDKPNTPVCLSPFPRTRGSNDCFVDFDASSGTYPPSVSSYAPRRGYAPLGNGAWKRHVKPSE